VGVGAAIGFSLPGLTFVARKQRIFEDDALIWRLALMLATGRNVSIAGSTCQLK
jgi:hypothetical protein